MHLKRFRHTNVRDALRAVRAEFGPDALVLSTALVPARGVRGLIGAREVEITAAAERKASAARLEESADRHHDADNAAASDLTARLAATGLDRAIAEEVAAAVPPAARRGASFARVRDVLATRLSELAAVAEDYARVEVFVGPP